jgi:hypothetical protein
MMKRRDYFIQYAAALAFFALCSMWIRTPGYMDAEYYTVSAIQLVEGKGMTQPILWNYLDDPAGLPHPSHTYWMPAPSLAAIPGMLITGKADFPSGRILFILIAALAAPAAGWMGFRFSGHLLTGWLAASLAIFCGFYAPYSSTIDSFFLIMPGAWLIFFGLDRVISTETTRKGWYWFLIGLACGWMHLNRADGFLWLLLSTGFWLFLCLKEKQGFGRKWPDLLILVAGYFMVMGFWFYRNLTLYGSLFIPNTSRALWVTRYNEIFSYPPDLLTFQHWFSSGIGPILTDRLGAFGYDLVIMIAVQGLIFLSPFWIYAAWKRRKDPVVLAGMGMELILLLIMSFIFPFTGKQGGFLHSTSALQSLIWGLSAAGIHDGLAGWAKRSGWDVDRTFKMYASGLAVLSLIVTIFVFNMLVMGGTPSQPVWDESARRAGVSDTLLKANSVPENARIMINNPAGFWLTSKREAVVIPDGTPETALAVANTFGVEYMILEKYLVTGMFDMYRNPNSNPGFTLLGKSEDQLLFQINLYKADGS